MLWSCCFKSCRLIPSGTWQLLIKFSTWVSKNHTVSHWRSLCCHCCAPRKAAGTYLALVCREPVHWQAATSSVAPHVTYPSGGK